MLLAALAVGALRPAEAPPASAWRHLTRRPVLLRAGLDALGTMAFLSALFHMPIANASAINLASPLFIAAYAALAWRERIGRGRWLAILVGFAGVLLVVQPAAEKFNAWSLMCLLGSALQAGRDLVTRRIAANVPSILITLSTAWATVLGRAVEPTRRLGSAGRATTGAAGHCQRVPEHRLLPGDSGDAQWRGRPVCGAIGEHGLALVKAAAKTGRARVLTHCNAGWLATVDWGTAFAPIYKAREAGVDVHVWVDETRPRNQGLLTAWELTQHGVPHTVIADNAGGHLMQWGEVDLCLVGTDRTTRSGDVCNKIGTYLKALAARDNGVPFYAAVPSPSIDWTRDDGSAIPIEERSGDEVRFAFGREVVPAGSPVANPAFDVTPRRLVTGLVTERGVARASADGLRSADGAGFL